MNPTEPQDLEDQSSFLSVTVYPSEGGHIVSMAFPKKGQSFYARVLQCERISERYRF